MNTRSAERINGLLVLLRGYAAMAGELAGAQWNEGDVSCSVVRRVALPDAFFAIDGLFETFADGARRVRRLPGGDRPRARPLPAVPRDDGRADGGGPGRGRPGDRARGDQGARRRRSRWRCGRRARPTTTCSPGCRRRAAGAGAGCARRPAGRPAVVHRRGVGAGRGGRRPGRRTITARAHPDAGRLHARERSCESSCTRARSATSTTRRGRPGARRLRPDLGLRRGAADPDPGQGRGAHRSCRCGGSTSSATSCRTT